MTKAESEATHSSPLCFQNMALKHNCTSQRDTIPDKQQHESHPGTVKRPRATHIHKVHVCTWLCSKEGALRGGLAAAGRGINSWLPAKLWSQWLAKQPCSPVTLQPSSSAPAGRQWFLSPCSINSSSHLTCTSSMLVLPCPLHLRDTDPRNYLFLSVIRNQSALSIILSPVCLSSDTTISGVSL